MQSEGSMEFYGQNETFLIFVAAFFAFQFKNNKGEEKVKLKDFDYADPVRFRSFLRGKSVH